MIFGRALIGLGVSACLMASFKAYSDWFPPERLALAYGCQLGAGGLGALAATIPISYMMPFLGWRGIFWILALLSAFISVLIFVMVPRHRGFISSGNREGLIEQLRGFSLILRSPLFWRVAPFASAVQAAALAELNLWTGPWLRDVGYFFGVFDCDDIILDCFFSDVRIFFNRMGFGSFAATWFFLFFHFGFI